jgi:hypothetical protein
MLARPHQLRAIANSGLIGVFLSSRWAEAKRTVQAAQVLFWWPTIEETIRNSAPGSCWRVPFSFVGSALEPLQINMPAAAQVTPEP